MRIPLVHNTSMYNNIKNKVTDILRLTMYDFECLNSERIDNIINEYLNNVTFEEDNLYYNNQLVDNFFLFVAEIKRRIQSTTMDGW